MTDYLGRKLLFVFIFVLQFSVLYGEGNQRIKIKKANTDDSIYTITGKTVNYLLQNNLFGGIIDIYPPTKILNCFVFVFKKDGIIYHVAANIEDRTRYTTIEDINTDDYIAIGYYSIFFPDGTTKKMFKGSYGTPFDWLNDINIYEYITIYDLEQRLNKTFDCIERGSFYSPFFEYKCIIDDSQTLYIMGSPSDNKKTSYFIGGWTYFSKRDR